MNFNGLIQTLPAGPIDIIGDVHGEYEVLRTLVKKLGYDDNGNHKENRKLVFIGDLCDRGPNSPAVIFYVKKLVENKNAFSILGNHELNILVGDVKDGSGWYFNKQRKIDNPKYKDYVFTNGQDRVTIKNFLSTLPVVYERDDIRIVHSTWDTNSINQIRAINNLSLLDAYSLFEKKSLSDMKKHEWYFLYLKQKDYYYSVCHNEDIMDMPFMNGIYYYDLYKNLNNPIRLITSGIEKRADKPFYAAGRWRFTTRRRWWLEYTEDTPVVIGHYWRVFENKFKNRLFPEKYNAWLGNKKNVFCIDFSIGASWKDRLKKRLHDDNSVYKLAALRWPEKELFFDNGYSINTI